MALSEVNVSLNIQNNRDYPQQINVMGNPANLLDTANATREFRYDVTAFIFTNENSVSIQYKLNSASSYNTFVGILPSQNIQGVITVLNSLQIGYFNTYTQLGSTYISTYNNNFTFGDINIYSSISLLSLTFDSITNVPVASATSVSNWNTFFNTSVNATTPFNSVSVVGNTVNLVGCSNLSVAANLFNSNQHIVSITDNLTIITIQSNAFFNCNFLTSININNCNIINTNSFASCAILSNVIMPKLTNIGAGAFNGIAITQILNSNFPLVTIISNGAFQGCGNLTILNLPNCLSIDDTAFDLCVNLTSVSLASVQNIGIGVFGTCIGLTTISLPSVISIGDSAMLDCTSLTSIYIPACLNLGSTTGDNGVFNLIIGNNITLTIPLATSTDGDVVYLQTNNTVTLITT